ncbi:hypothetical protein PHYBLDRAFT_63979 [Phycomyces blakesleeanus NRRL 1555(-)]|uniref:Uncharacterized protein n=1 Tax=Phycomyces blakesleeanus (strain ATCC 8743b / DSM 1359 / FGSC 10004 / NBRC 33097 / NRRL 1555) TaxID=763407 RepID=A0A167LRL4_PHYB8|nr:hypothetical protein PHYBLDRAFT_63979 [Phycomyces blakesleeanus NRRL 1555(-)]OAD70954.1 hypothetical protein PHYBLDRAFT_63979 [Phycomyces blakesleeanus NRRL 1555(-)]|eukprot:XP_018288994.1 hypothetical protein PHYBLDRAFT_63979 [Phycomyces blakesleeanus NRRL 1555(-)]
MDRNQDTFEFSHFRNEQQCSPVVERDMKAWGAFSALKNLTRQRWFDSCITPFEVMYVRKMFLKGVKLLLRQSLISILSVRVLWPYLQRSLFADIVESINLLTLE